MTEIRRAVLLNGLSMTGKDTLANTVIDCRHITHPNTKMIKAECKARLFEATYQFFNISRRLFFAIYENRDLKEKPLKQFSISFNALKELRKIISVDTTGREATQWKVPLSIREAMIFVSEVVLKPTFGSDYFGVYRAEYLRGYPLGVDGYDELNMIDASAGFAEEIPPLVELLGMENILLIRVYRDIESQSDSRTYLPDGVIDNTINIYNETDKMDEYLKTGVRIINEFLDS